MPEPKCVKSSKYGTVNESIVDWRRKYWILIMRRSTVHPGWHWRHTTTCASSRRWTFFGCSYPRRTARRMFHQSFATGTGPSQWKTAVIFQDSRARSAIDFRPISITSVLSRLLEKFVVRKFIYPALLQQYPSLDFSDQLAFRQSGSTTAAIVAMLHTVRSMLADNNYVHVFSFDFSKAFDTVRHALLTSKLAQLELPDSMYNWAVDLDYHAHCTKLAGAISEIAIIHAQRHSRIGARTSILHCHCVRSVHCPRPKPASQPNCVVSEHFGQ